MLRGGELDGMLRPILGIWERDLERALLRKGVDDLRAGAPSCSGCGRVPLVGEQIAVFNGGAVVCELCRPAHGGAPISVERVQHHERGRAVRLRVRAA